MNNQFCDTCQGARWVPGVGRCYDCSPVKLDPELRRLINGSGARFPHGDAISQRIAEMEATEDER